MYNVLELFVGNVEPASCLGISRVEATHAPHNLQSILCTNGDENHSTYVCALNSSTETQCCGTCNAILRHMSKVQGFIIHTMIS